MKFILFLTCSCFCLSISQYGKAALHAKDIARSKFEKRLESKKRQDRRDFYHANGGGDFVKLKTSHSLERRDKNSPLSLQKRIELSDFTLDVDTRKGDFYSEKKHAKPKNNLLRALINLRQKAIEAARAHDFFSQLTLNHSVVAFFNEHCSELGLLYREKAQEILSNSQFEILKHKVMSEQHLASEKNSELLDNMLSDDFLSQDLDCDRTEAYHEHAIAQAKMIHYGLEKFHQLTPVNKDALKKAQVIQLAAKAMILSRNYEFNRQEIEAINLEILVLDPDNIKVKLAFLVEQIREAHRQLDWQECQKLRYRIHQLDTSHPHSKAKILRDAAYQAKQAGSFSLAVFYMQEAINVPGILPKLRFNLEEKKECLQRLLDASE